MLESTLARRSFFPTLSVGERRFLVALCGTGVLGAVLACIGVMRLSDTSPASQSEFVFTYWTAVAGFVGAAGGFMSSYSRWFGHIGSSGWLSALCGAMVLSGVGSVVAGSLILPLYGTMFGPLQLVTTLIAHPLLAVSWIGMLICVHGLLRPWRAERDSIFV